MIKSCKESIPEAHSIFKWQRQESARTSGGMRVVFVWGGMGEGGDHGALRKEERQSPLGEPQAKARTLLLL